MCCSAGTYGTSPVAKANYIPTTKYVLGMDDISAEASQTRGYRFVSERKGMYHTA